MDTTHKGIDAEKVLGRKMDHRIINAALNIQDLEPERSTTLVTKDINLRLKAKALHLNSEDYLTGKIKDMDALFKGKSIVENFNAETLTKLYAQKSLDIDEVVAENPTFQPFPNSYYVLKSDNSSGLAYFNAIDKSLDHVENDLCTALSQGMRSRLLLFMLF